GEIVSCRRADAGLAAGESGDAVHWPGHAGVDPALAEMLLSPRLDFTGIDPGTGKPLAGPPAFSGMAAARRLAAGDFAVAGGADLRIFLGDVELLVLAAMDLSHAGRAVPARLRHAAAGLWRLPPIRAGIVRAQKPALGPWPGTGA